MDKEQLLKMYAALKNNPGEIVKAAARHRLINFARYMQPDLALEPFHVVYYTLLDKFAHGEIKKMIVQMPPQHGKEISDNQIVATTKGLKKHGDLIVGDYVFGRDGTPVKVLWVSEKTRSEYVVSFSDGAKIECHGNHEWTVYNRFRQKEETIETKHMASSTIYNGDGKRGSRYKYQVDSNVCVMFDSRNVDLDPYVLGAWLGDGDSSCGIIHIGNNDVEIIGNSTYKFKESKGTTTRKFYSPELNLLLKNNGLLKNKHIPDMYKYNSVEVRKNVIAGLIDTDGYVYHRNGRITISNTNKRIIDDAAFILRSLGQSVVVCEFKPRVSSSGIVGKKIVYQLCFNPTMTFPTKVKRKKITKLSINKKRAIVSIERKEGLGYGNCIQVDGGIYLVGDTFIPTHNSEGSSRKLPAFMLGLNPDTKICIGSYASTIARDFNRDVQRIIDTPSYRELFPGTYLNGSNVVTMANTYLRNSDVIEMVGRKGSLRVVGRGGSLTSKTVDVSILDDVYKDYAEGNSPIVRNAAWKWYTTVVRTRLHNDSQELIVFTRWHDDDLIGRIEKSGETVIEIKSWDDVKNIPAGAWVRINFEGLKTGEPTEIDPREPGAALWDRRHSRAKLEGQRALDPVQFQCLYQGNPGNAEGKLYRNPFRTYVDKSEWGTYVRSGNYTDVADEGDDFTFSACYDVYKSGNEAWNEQKKRFEPILYALITDMVFTQENTEITAVTVPEMINRCGTQKAWIESNNGGSGFEKVIRKKLKAVTEPFYQGANKESRIITNSAMVNAQIIMPIGWEQRFSKIYEHLTGFLRDFPANAHDDPEDGLTGIYEKELADGDTRPYSQATRGVKRRN
nr:MAG TPA: Terminase large subunit [Caudoviricetes sp.]